MASIWKHPKSPFFMACYTDHLGKRRKRTTKQSGRREALRVAQEFEDLERAARKNHVTTHALQRFASDLNQSLTGQSLETPSITRFLEDWIEGKKSRNAKLSTIERYTTVKNLFLKSLERMREAPISAIGGKHLESFLRQRLKAGTASKTVFVDMKILRAAFNEAVGFGHIVVNPARMVKLPEVQSEKREIFTVEEIKKLIEAAFEEESQWTTMILLGATTGARLKDCANMRWENIDWNTQMIRYIQAKTGKTVDVPLHPDLDDHFEMYRVVNETGFICPEMAARAVDGKHGLSASFIRLMKRAGVDPKTIERKNKRKFSTKSFHSLRYTFNTILYENGVDQEVRRKIIGHSSMFMNDHYTKPAVEPLKRAMDKMPSVY